MDDDDSTVTEHPATPVSEHPASPVSEHPASEHPDPALTERPSVDVVVVGAGLAGLTAAVTAARAGAGVTLFDAARPGGRARTTVVDPGVVFNGGPRALYRNGPAWEVLSELGIDPTGGAPPTDTGHVMRGGRREVMPATPGRLLRTGALGWRAKVAVGRLLGAIDEVDASTLQGRPLGEWARDTLRRPDAVALVLAVARLATYVDDPEHMDAGAAVAQLQLVLGSGVLYLDDGFGQLVEALRARAEAAGVQIVDHATVRGLRALDGAERTDRTDDAGPRWLVEHGDGTHLARRVVLATGTPAAAAGLSPVPIDASGVGEPVVAACLELAIHGVPETPFLLGLDEPLYLSLHSPPASLAPEGIGVVHVMRYGITSADADRAALWRHARAAGIDEGSVVAQRFLRRMVVTGGAPLARSGGLTGRPAVAVPDAPGLFLAGDWVGERGLLSDAALASGELAGRLAAEGRADSGDPDRTGGGVEAARAVAGTG
jgi:phytoene dehydrogenase-like protein